jgi:hypothetical protein
MLFDVFIGCSRSNSSSAAAIQAALEQAGLHCYRDVTNIAGSDEWRAAISADKDLALPVKVDYFRIRRHLEH